MTVYLLHFSEPYRHAMHYRGSARDVPARLRKHASGHGARLLAVVKAAGITWELARTWPGGRERERQLKRQGGAARQCPLCGVRPRGELPRNRDGSLSRSLTSDADKLAAGVMTAAQLAEHTALRRGAVTGKLPRPFDRGPLAADPWAIRPACPLPAVTAGRTP